MEQGLALPPPRGLHSWQVTPYFSLRSPPHPHFQGPPLEAESLDVPSPVPTRKGAEMLRGEQEMEDVRGQSGRLAGHLFLSCASLRHRAARRPQSSGLLPQRSGLSLPWLVSLPGSEIQFAKISPGLGDSSLALSLAAAESGPHLPFPVSFQISRMKLILFKPLTAMQLRALGPVNIFFSKLSPSSDGWCPLNCQIWGVCVCVCDMIYDAIRCVAGGKELRRGCSSHLSGECDAPKDSPSVRPGLAGAG